MRRDGYRRQRLNRDRWRSAREPRPPNTIQSHIDLALFDARLPCEIVLDASSTALMLAAVIAKFGVIILPWSAVHVELDENTFKLIKIDRKLFSRELLLCWHDNGLLRNAVQKVKLAVLEIFESLGRSEKWVPNLAGPG